MTQRDAIIPLHDPMPDPGCIEMIRQKVLRARAAQAEWKKLSPAQRLALLRQFRPGIVRQPLALVQSGVLGRSAQEVLTSEVIPLLDACKFLENQAARILRPRKRGMRGRPLWLFGHSAVVHRVPLGVVLIIAPGNYPILLPGIQVLQALAAGNAVLLKPGFGGTAAGEFLLDLLKGCGLPGELVQILDESPSAGQAALHSGVDKVFFTGTVTTGQRIQEELAPQLVPSVMELSGLDAMIVMPGADLRLAAEAVAFGLSLNFGRTCIAPRRIFVPTECLARFQEVLQEACDAREIFGLPRSRTGTFLPHLSEALVRGAKALTGSVEDYQRLRFPLVLGDVPQDSRLRTEDFFLPLSVLESYGEEEDLLQKVASSSYGLGASIFSKDLPAACRLAEQLRAGVVTINDLIVPTADPRLPFGGRCQSGYGVTRGEEGLLEMTSVQVITHRKGNERPHFQPPESSNPELFLSYIQSAHGRGWATRLRAGIRLLKACSREMRARHHQFKPSIQAWKAVNK